MADETIYAVDAQLSISDMDPTQAAHVAGVLNRVVAGLAMEGFNVCFHMGPTIVMLPVNEDGEVRDV